MKGHNAREVCSKGASQFLDSAAGVCRGMGILPMRACNTRTIGRSPSHPPPSPAGDLQERVPVPRAVRGASQAFRLELRHELQHLVQRQLRREDSKRSLESDRLAEGAGRLAHGDGAVTLLHPWPTVVPRALPGIIDRLCEMFDESVAADFYKLGFTIIQGYGLSETSPVVSSNFLNLEEFSGTIGYPVPSTDVSITGSPRAGRAGPRRPPLSHVPPHGALRDRDAELQQLAPDALGAPQPILLREPTDEVPHLPRQPWPSGRPPRLPPPEGPPPPPVRATDTAAPRLCAG